MVLCRRRVLGADPSGTRRGSIWAGICGAGRALWCLTGGNGKCCAAAEPVLVREEQQFNCPLLYYIPITDTALQRSFLIRMALDVPT